MSQTATALAVPKDLADEAANIKKTIGAPSGTMITTKGKLFTFPDGTTHPGPIRAVILDYISHNSYFKGVYDPANIVPPDCFALDKVIEDMKPSAKVADPQHDNCPTCPRNQFGSAVTGRGKACKNTRRVAIVPPDATKDTQPMILATSPTAIKNFDAHVSRIARDFGTPPIAVITTIGFNPGEAYPTLQFSDPTPHDKLETMMYLRPQAQDMLAREPDLTKRQTDVASTK